MVKKRKIGKNAKILFITFFSNLILCVNPVFSTPSPTDSEKTILSIYYDITTEIATKTETPLKDVPAIVTVITQDEIKKSGARDLTDVLNLLPGVHITMSSMASVPIVNIRGIGTDGSEKVFFMVDGHPVNQGLTGGGTLHFADMPVEAIKRVEFLRGTGSSLYGANAFLGVINIVTRDAKDIDGVGLTLKYGSFDSKTIYFEAGKEFEENKAIWGNVTYYNTGGADVFIQKDALNKDPFSPNAKISNAPGNTNESIERTDVLLGIKWDKFLFQAQAIDKKHGGYFNVSSALNDNTNISKIFYYAFLRYEDSFFSDLLKVTSNLYFNQYDYTGDLHLHPPGYINPNNIRFPKGRRSIQTLTLDRYGFNFQGDINIDKHTLTFGVDLRNSSMHDIKHIANYSPRPLLKMTDVSRHFNWMAEADRFSYGLFIQEQWDVNDRLKLTGGLRYDNHDDKSEDNLSPNLSLLYKLTENSRIKLIYGEAFRAPAFRELYKLPAGSPKVGNPDLKPEKARTYQGGFEWEPNDCFNINFYAFLSDYDQLLNEVWNPHKKMYMFKNVGEVDAKGFELSLKYHFLKNRPLSRLFLNISYSDTEDEKGRELAASPNWVISSGIDWDITKNIHFHINNQYISSSDTLPEDKRDKFPSYWLTNMAFTLKDMMGFKKDMDLRAGVYNLFDIDYAYPNLSGEIPENYVRPGISFELSINYRF